MKIMKILVILFILMAIPSGCSSEATPSTPPLSSTPATTASPSPSVTIKPPLPSPQKHMLEVVAVPDKPAYLPGETVRITLSITNVTGESLTLDNFPYTVEVSHVGWVVKTFFLGDGPDHLTPGETRTYSFEWDQTDYEGNPVNPAVYWIALLEIWITQDSSGIQHGEGYLPDNIIINYPQGAMQKTINVNQSLTIDDITLTLTRVELTDTGISVYMEKIPVPPLTGGMPPGDFNHGRADFQIRYRFDDGRTFKTDIDGWLVSQDYVAYTCTYLYPAPSDARTLFFTIESMSLFEDGTYGPFEFEVPLQ
jgi:hypothetical protein